MPDFSRSDVIALTSVVVGLAALVVAIIHLRVPARWYVGIVVALLTLGMGIWIVRAPPSVPPAPAPSATVDVMVTQNEPPSAPPTVSPSPDEPEHLESSPVAKLEWWPEPVESGSDSSDSSTRVEGSGCATDTPDEPTNRSDPARPSPTPSNLHRSPAPACSYEQVGGAPMRLPTLPDALRRIMQGRTVSVGFTVGDDGHAAVISAVDKDGARDVPAAVIRGAAEQVRRSTWVPRRRPCTPTAQSVLFTWP